MKALTERAVRERRPVRTMATLILEDGLRSEPAPLSPPPVILSPSPLPPLVSRPLGGVVEPRFKQPKKTRKRK